MADEADTKEHDLVLREMSRDILHQRSENKITEVRANSVKKQLEAIYGQLNDGVSRLSALERAIVALGGIVPHDPPPPPQGVSGRVDYTMSIGRADLASKAD